jgi:hypothetical protein
VIRRVDFDTPGDALPRPLANSYWLLPGRVLAGEHPANAGAEALDLRLAALADAGLSCFVDLTGEPDDPRRGYQPLPVAGRPARREPHGIADFGLPTPEGMRRVLDAIGAALDSGDGVYLHCRAGIGRTGTVAGCLLVEHGFAPDEALALLARKWKAMAKSAFVARTPETPAQREFVAAWVPGRGA